MPKVIIAFGEQTLVTRLPDDAVVQGQLLDAGLVFDFRGQCITVMPAEGRLDSSSYYCVPFAGLVRLMQAIGNCIGQSRDSTIQLVLADPVFFVNDKAAKLAILSCLQQVFGPDLPVSFADDGVRGCAQECYLRECKEVVAHLSIARAISKYKNDQDSNKRLDERVINYYIDRSSKGEVDELLALHAAIDSFVINKEEDLNALLLSLYEKRLRKSANSILVALQQKEQPGHTIFITSNRLQAESASGALENLSVICSDPVNLMRNPKADAVALFNQSTLGFMVEAMLDGVNAVVDASQAPFCILAAYMHILRGAVSREAFESQYPGAHFFITHPLLTSAITKTANHNSPYLRERFQAFSEGLGQLDANSLLSDASLHYHLEVLLAEFTGFFRGERRDNVRPLVTIIPTQIIQAWKLAVDTYQDTTILSRLFLMWIASQLEAANSNVLSRFIGDLRQISTSYTEKPELMERLERTLAKLNQVLIGEIEKTQREESAVVEAGLPVLDETTIATDGEVAIPIPALSVIQQDPSTRIEIFTIRDTVSAREFLETHLRLAGKPRENVAIVCTAREGAIFVVAIAYHESGKTVYYRRDQGNRLSAGNPLINSPILSVNSQQLLNGEQKLTIAWGVDPQDLYIGAHNSDKHILPEMALQLIDNFPESSALAPLYQEFVRLMQTDAGYRAPIQEIFSVMDPLIRQEAEFLELPNSEQGIVSSLRQAYAFMVKQQKAEFFRYAITHAGVAAEMGVRGEKYLALFGMLLNLGALLTLPVLVFAGRDTVLAINNGDTFFYLTKLNAELMRAAILAIFVGAPALAVGSIAQHGLKLIAQTVFGRALTRLPPGISDAVIAGASYQTFIARVHGTLLHLCRDALVLPSTVRDFMSALKTFAEMSERSSALPGPVRHALMEVGGKIMKDLQRGSQYAKTHEQIVLKRIKDAERGLLKGVVSVDLIAAIGPAVLAGVYYGLINTGTGDNALSQLTRGGMYALGVAALYLLWQLSVNTVSAGITLSTYRGGFFNKQQAAETEPGLQASNIQGEADDESRPLLARPQQLRNPGRGCRCIIS